MAAKTPATVTIVGVFPGAKVIKASFTDLDDGDTWTPTSITGVVGQIAQDTDDPTTQASVGCAVAYSSGVFTFYPAEDNKTVDLYILARS